MLVNKKKVAFYIGDFTRSGGTERTAITIANGLAKSEVYDVYLVVTNFKKEKSFFYIDDSVKVIYLNVMNVKKNYVSLQFKICKFLSTNSINVFIAVEVFSLFFILTPYYVSKIYNKDIKLITWEHFNFSVNAGHKLRHYARRLALKYSDYIIVLTEKDKIMWENTRKSNAKVSVLAIGNASPFRTVEREYDPKNRKIVAIGRLTNQKGFDLLINIWSKLLKKYPDVRSSNWHLDIIGEGEDFERLKNLVTCNNVESSVFLRGGTNNIQEYYESASFLAMSSRYEGLPMTLLEAQSYGLPIIAYDCLTGPSDIISAESGILVEMFNEDLFVEGLKRMMDSEELRYKMSKSALKEVENYSLDNILSLWDLLLIKI